MDNNFKKSSFCGTSTCVEVDKVSIPDTIFVYDAHGNRCTYDFEEWRAFIAGVKNGEFDV